MSYYGYQTRFDRARNITSIYELLTMKNSRGSLTIRNDAN
ncbi:hypothetical protein GBP346_B1230 [Burkholderia pseudomallei MSHR346]|nr:hypothetical protein GBP346_B1230 [Burkholderia pseudomallei MSHR346]